MSENISYIFITDREMRLFALWERFFDYYKHGKMLDVDYLTKMLLTPRIFATWLFELCNEWQLSQEKMQKKQLIFLVTNFF